MAGKIQWQLEFVGLDLALAKLREIDRLLQRITGRQGSFGGNTPNSTGGSPNSHGGPTPPNVSNASSAASNAAIGSALAAGSAGMDIRAIRRKQAAAAGNQPSSPNSQRERQNAAENLGAPMPKGDLIKRAAEVIQSGRVSIPPPQPFPKVMGDVGPFRSVSGAGGGPRWPFHFPPESGFGPSSFLGGPMGHMWGGAYGGGIRAVPPVIPPPRLPTPQMQGPTWKDAVSIQGLKADLGKLGEKTKTAFMTEGLFGGLKALRGAFLAITAAGFLVAAVLKVLKMAFDLLLEGIKHGAEVYQRGAASGIGIKRSNQLEEALRAIGITEAATFQMRQVAGAGGGTSGIVGAARASGFGGAQQLQNMSKEFEMAMANAASSARQMELAGYANQKLSQEWLALGREFRTMLAQTAASLYPILHAFFQQIQDFMKIVNLYIEILNRIKSLVPGLTAIGPKPGEANWPGGGGRPSITGWEKIGFTFGRGGPTEALAGINNNTKKTSETLTSIYEYLKIFARLSGNPIMAPAAQFLP